MSKSSNVSNIPNPPNKNLTELQIQRYSRTILLEQVGAKGMQRLLKSTVGIIGGGGLGCPAIQMLASAGIGHIRIADGDTVDISNLPRQILHFTSDVGKLKVESIKNKISQLNPDVELTMFPHYISKENIISFLQGCDYVIEASDSSEVKFLVNDACVFLNIPFTIAGVVQFYGQILSIIPGKTTCYRCLFHNPTPADANNSCSGVGVINTAPSFAGILEANEAIKSIVGLEKRFVDQLFVFDLLEATFNTIPVKRNLNCLACSKPEIAYYKDANYKNLQSSCNL